jgi:threonine synthase
MTGLAHDRGLFVPDSFPTVTDEEVESWRGLSYADLAVKVISKFVKDDQVPADKLEDIVKRSCAAFRHEDVTPVVEVAGHAVLELFHGPTFAFKDVALQMLGNFFEYFLETGSNGGRLAVLGATSGDTGSAAIYGLRGKKGIDCIILFPRGRVSPIQERQMTTVQDSNIHCVAVEGTFDDCQDLVKASFNTPEFRDRVKLGAVNSINWCRVLAQTTYYFWSYLRVTDKAELKGKPVSFSVPTGNFGDILAGFYAKQMGLNVGKLIVATNENDILNRFFTKGEYHREPIAKSISPSMDICVSSNFERYLFFLAGNDSEKLAGWMKTFESTKKLDISGDLLQKAQSDFSSARADTKMTLETIKEYNEKHNYVMCPHTAVGVNAIHQLGEVNSTMVCLATAHDGKFPAAVKQAIDPLPDAPKQLAALAELPTRVSDCPNDLKTVQDFMEKRIAERIAAQA